MGRKRRGGVGTFVRLPIEDKVVLGRLASTDRRTVSDLIRFAVEEYLDRRLKGEKEDGQTAGALSQL